MTTDSVTRSRARTRPESQVTPIVTATVTGWVSRRKLNQSSYLVCCPSCETYRNHLASGLRRCPCGQMYRIAVGAVVGAVSS